MVIWIWLSWRSKEKAELLQGISSYSHSKHKEGKDHGGPQSLCTTLVVYRNYKSVLSRQGSIFGLYSMAGQREVFYYATVLWLVKQLLSGHVKPWILSVQFRSSSCSLTSRIMSCAFTVNTNAFVLALWSHVLSIASDERCPARCPGPQQQPSTHTSAFPCGPSYLSLQSQMAWRNISNGVVNCDEGWSCL